MESTVIQEGYDPGAVATRLRAFVSSVKEIQANDAGDEFRPLTAEELQKLKPVLLQMEGTDALAPRPGHRSVQDNFGRVVDPTLKHTSMSPYSSMEAFHYPVYNFSEIIAIEETEGLAARAFGRKEGLALKEGWAFVGKNPKTVKYVRDRLDEVCYRSQRCTEELIRSTVSDLIRFSNHFESVVRSREHSSGRSIRQFGKTIPPIAGLFPIPAETVQIKHDRKGNPIALKQEGYGSNKPVIFGRANYLHFKINDKTGYAVGTPTLVPGRDDIAVLRRIEEDVEILLYQYLFPLYQYKVGTEKMPARINPDGTTELDEVQKQVSSLPSEGAIVTPERHDIDVLGAKQAALDALPYLEYFKARVLADLGISRLDIGESNSSNRSTSDSLSRILIDGVKYIQRRTEWQFWRMLLQPLLLESSFPASEMMKEENRVYLRFNEIDIDMLIKKQNHHAQMFSQHATTLPELRRSIGEEPFTEEQWLETHYKKHQEPMELLKNKASGHSAEAEALARNPNSEISSSGVSKEQEREKKEAEQRKAQGAGAKPTSGQKAGAGQNRPSNQHGKKAGPDPRKSAYMPASEAGARASAQEGTTIQSLLSAINEVREQVTDRVVAEKGREGKASVDMFYNQLHVVGEQFDSHGSDSRGSLSVREKTSLFLGYLSNLEDGLYEE